MLTSLRLKPHMYSLSWHANRKVHILVYAYTCIDMRTVVRCKHCTPDMWRGNYSVFQYTAEIFSEDEHKHNPPKNCDLFSSEIQRNNASILDMMSLSFDSKHAHTNTYTARRARTRTVSLHRIFLQHELRAHKHRWHITSPYRVRRVDVGTLSQHSVNFRPERRLVIPK